MILDILVVLTIAYGFYSGYSRGIINTFFDILSIIVALFAALKLSPFIIDLLNKIIVLNPSITFLIGVVLTFILVMAAIRFLGNRLEDLFEESSLNIVNKLAGGGIMAMLFAFIVSSFLWLLSNINILNEDIKEESITYPILEPLPHKGKEVFTRLKPVFTDFWDKLTETTSKNKETSNN